MTYDLESLRATIAVLASEYGDEAFKEKPFRAGVDRVPVSRKKIGGGEMIYGVSALLDGWLTEGHWTDKFEEKFAKYLGVRFSSFCNSGSSANFLALGACTSPLLKERRLMPGDPVLTTALGFPTTINPIYFWRLKPIFIDVELGTYVAHVDDIDNALVETLGDRGAMMMAHTLGNPWRAHEYVNYGGIFIIEDNCDGLGGLLSTRRMGSLGHISTNSFYPAHQMTTGEGGMVSTNNGRLKKAIESIRDWGRACWCPPGHDNTCGKRFEWRFADLPTGYDHKYVYSHLGLNLKSTDIQAAIGLAQLESIDTFKATRRKNFTRLLQGLKSEGLDEIFILPEPTFDSDPAWFGFPLTIRGRDTAEIGPPIIARSIVLEYLNNCKIDTRLFFAGNYLSQPLRQHIPYIDEGRVFGSLDNTNKVARDGFWIGCHHAMTDEMVDYVIRCFIGFRLEFRKHARAS